MRIASVVAVSLYYEFMMIVSVVFVSFDAEIINNITKEYHLTLYAALYRPL